MDDSEDEEDGEETGGGRVDDDNDDETLQLEELSVADDGPRRAEVEGVAGAHGCTRSSRGGINHARYQRIFDECDGLQKLMSELKTQFQLENITAVSYALAVCINSDRTTEADRSETRCLLANRNMLAREFVSTHDYTFYPQAFHPVYGNVSSNCPPMFLNSLFAAMKGNMSDQNEGADVLSFSYFQGYSNIKRSVRHSPHDLLATKGYVTGALTMPTSDAGATSAAREKRERLLRIIRGPNKSKPFARERQQINVAVEAEEVAFQLKQVVSLDVRRMTGAKRTFKTVIRPIFQIIRFFLIKHKSFVHIFHSLLLEIFPRIMCAYLRLFELVLDEMEQAVAIVDRLGGYMFSGHPRHLPRTVLRPLGTLESLWAGGWPFLDPAVVSLGAPGSGGAVINMGRWPHSARTGRPVLLHVRELHHHYGARVASCRENAVWFAQLGEHAFASKTAVAVFAEELVRELWVLQTRTFIMQQLRRRLHEGGGDPGRPITMENIASCETTMAAWEAAPNAFTWKALQRLCRGLRLGGERVAIAVSKQRTRHDFVAELLRVIGSEKGRDSFAAKNATWPLTLHFAIINGRCFLAAGIEWVPDSVRGQLTSRSVVRLGGQATVQPAPFGPPGSLRRAAREAEIKHERTVKDQVQRQECQPQIDFGCPLPFTNIPSLILAGFNQTKATFLGKGDAKVLDHYQIAMNCLAEKIDDPLCHLMLMITLTICASSETPEVAQGSRTFSAAAKRKDPGQLALVMVTRMMWFLYPTSFPWAKNSGGTAYDVMEMTKKIEHKGCSNYMLRELSWVTSTSKRDSSSSFDMVKARLHIMANVDLLTLPAELVNKISEDLSSDDLLALRLACRRMRDMTSASFQARFFCTRFVMLEKESLSNLVTISHDPTLSRAVQAVELCIDHLIQPQHYISREGLFNLGINDEYDIIRRLDGEPVLEGDDSWESIRRGYEDGWNDQVGFFRQNLHMGLLVEALSNLQNCRRVGLGDHVRPWGAFRLGSRIGTLPNRFVSNLLPNSLIHAVVSIRTLLYAVIKSRLPVEHISIEFGDSMAGCTCVIPKMLLLPRNLERAVSSQLHTVTTLRLMVNPTPRDNKFDCEMPPTDPTSGETQGWISEFLAFLGLFTVISDLNLVFMNRDERYQFPELSQLLLVPGLRTLHLGFLDCTISKLTALLERHEATLQTVSLESVSLISEGLDSWLSVVAFLRHELSVEVLYLEGCFGEDAEHQTHITLPRSLYAENPQELDELVAELKHTQKKEDRIS
ncbi:F-box domain-containing protein [Colletotrichum asianum]